MDESESFGIIASLRDKEREKNEHKHRLVAPHIFSQFLSSSISITTTTLSLPSTHKHTSNMRFSTIIAASAITILSIVSAQIFDPAANDACNTCLNNAAISAVPVCKGLEDTKGDPNTRATDKQKACWCGLMTAESWANSCDGFGPDK